MIEDDQVECRKKNVGKARQGTESLDDDIRRATEALIPCMNSWLPDGLHDGFYLWTASSRLGRESRAPWDLGVKIDKLR